MDTLTPEKISEYYIFTFTRNPWDRIVSLSHYFGLKNPKAIKYANTRNFTQAYYTHSIPCSYATHSLLNGKQICDFIGRFENIEEDFAKICSDTGIKASLDFKNRGKHDHYVKSYNEQTIKAVRQKHSKDIDLFGYEFGK